MGQREIPEEIRETPIKPSGKGNKRKHDDVALEEQQSWAEVLQGELLEEDDDYDEDPTYEPTKSETDSEEFKSQNDTETDLEFEEKDGIRILREHPCSQENLSGDNPQAVASNSNGQEPPAAANCSDPLAEAADGGNGIPENPVATCGSNTLLQKAVASIVQQPRTDASSNGQDQWVELSDK
uniref:Uncharacterized protein n=1 Tax=Sphenodon punctatus TaxID=8508 RepID=A0A8D0H4S8_SPHPU